MSESPTNSEKQTRRSWAVFPWATAGSTAAESAAVLISVVLPVYNHAKYLPEAIASITAACTRYKVEIVVINDGSTDNFQEAIAPFLLAHLATPNASRPRLIVKEQPNSGLAAALNLGFSEASGSFLTWTSADNLYEAQSLDTLADFLIANPAVGLTYGNITLIDDSGAELKDSNYRAVEADSANPAVRSLPNNASSLKYFQDNFINACFLFRRSVYQLLGNHRTDINGCEDYEYWLRLAGCATLAHVDTEKPLYRYRLHDETISSNLGSEKIKALTKVVFEKHEKLFSRVITPPVEVRYKLHPRISSGDRRSWCEKLAYDLEAPKSWRFRRLLRQLPLPPDSLQSFGLWQFKDGESGRSTSFASPYLSPPNTNTNGESGESFLLSQLPSGVLPITIGYHGTSNNSLVLATPLPAPAVIRRARDANYGAIVKSIDHQGICSIFLPTTSNETVSTADSDLFYSELSALIQNTPNWTFALLAFTDSERTLADRLNLALNKQTNLRIVDLTKERGNTADFHRALMFVASSSDLFLGTHEPHSIYSAIRCREQLMIAALSGRRLVVVSNDRDTICQTTQNSPTAERFTEFAKQLWDPLLSAPHIAMSSYTAISKSGAEILQNNMLPPQIGSVEQWIQMQERTAYSAAIRGFSKYFEP